MIYIINGCGSCIYYALNDGEIHSSSSTGGVYIEDFIDKMQIEYTELTIHPDIRYAENGCHIGMSNISILEFDTINDIPKWFYCYDKNNPLLKQLTEEEFEEFVSMDSLPYITYPERKEGVKTFKKEWYIENGYR